MRDGDDRVGCGCVGKRTTAETALLAAAIAKAGGIDLMAALDVIDALESDGWKVGRE